MGKKLDLVGKKFGRYTVLYEDIELEQQKVSEGKTKSIYWKCLCECGREVSVISTNLLNGKSKGCKYCRDENRATPTNYVDLTGNKYGRLTVLGREDRKDGIKWVAYWRCKCDCGNECVVNGQKLTTGHTKSCGCLQKEKAHSTHFKDLSGKRFGKLVVIDRNIEAQGNSKQTYWNCVCDCGTRTVVTGGRLVYGWTHSCGCIRSYGEYLIKCMLNSANIPFESEVTFSNCRNNKRNKLRFDFLLKDDENKPFIVEFDGIQHFVPDNRVKNSKERLEEFRRRDLIKNEYCFNNSISLIRIPYVSLRDFTLSDLNPKTTRYLITKENEMSYYKNMEQESKKYIRAYI